MKNLFHLYYSGSWSLSFPTPTSNSSFFLRYFFVSSLSTLSLPANIACDGKWTPPGGQLCQDCPLWAVLACGAFNTDVDLLFLTAAGMRGGGGRRQEIEVRGRKVQGEKFQCTFKIRRVLKKNRKIWHMSMHGSGGKQKDRKMRGGFHSSLSGSN